MAAAATAWAASDAGWVMTGQSNAQTSINIIATSRFTITAKASGFIYGGDFVMKAGSQTKAPISFKLYDSRNKAKLLAEFTYVNTAAFCAAHGGDCQTFSATRFPFPTPVAIAAGKSYYAELTSPAPQPQSEGYFIKGGDQCRIVTETGQIVTGTDCSSGIVPPPEPKASLSIVKKGPATAYAPGKISYTLTVFNTGGAASSGAAIADQLPDGMSYSGFSGSGWSCFPPGNSGLIECRYNNDIPAGGQSVTLRINTTVDDSVSSVDNWAAVDPLGGDRPLSPSPSNCSAAAIQTGECDNAITDLEIAPPFLDIALSDPAPPPNNGDPTTYTVTVTNNGDGSTQQPVYAYNVLPAGTTFVSAGNTEWDCDHSSGTPDIVTCLFTGTTIRPGYSYDFPVNVTVNTPTPGGTTFVDTAYVGRAGGTIASPPAVCESDDTIACAQNVFVLPYAWEITKSSPSPALQVGDQSTYTLTVKTNGASVPTEVKDQLPAGMTLVSATGSGWQCSTEPVNLVVCSKTLSSTATETISVKVAVDPSLANQTVTNYASVGPEGDALTPGPYCDDPKLCASNTETVLAVSGYSLTKSDPVPPLEVGQESTYTLTLETDTPGTNATVKDLLPEGLTLVSAAGISPDWACSAVDQLVTCNKTGIGLSEEITVKVRVEDNVTAETMTNYASGGTTGSVPDPGPACPALGAAACAANESPVNLAAAFKITKSGPSPALQVGRESVYTLTVTTTGTDVAAEVKDLLPSGMTLVSATGDGWFCEDGTDSTVLCRKTITKNTTEEILVTVNVDDSTIGNSLTNYASTGAEGRAPPPGDGCTDVDLCASNTSNPVLGPAGYTISKSAPQPPLRVGQESVYTLTVTTDGTDVVADVKDQLPDGMTLVSAEGEGWLCGEPDNNLLQCRKTISSGASELIYVTVNVAPDTAGSTLVNHASVGPEGEAPTPGDGCSPEAACASRPADVTPAAGYFITKSKPEPPLQVNKQSTYYITVTSDAAEAVTEVKDQLPAGMRLVKAEGEGWDCSADASDLVLCSKTMAKDVVERIAVTVDVLPEINNQTVINYASVGGSGNAPPPGPFCTDESHCAESEAKVADIRDEIKDAVEEDVKAFLTARLDRIVGSFDQQSRLQRFRDTACGVTHDLQLSGEATSNAADLSGSGSFSMKGGIVPAADVPDEQCGRFNVWSEFGVSYVDALDSSAVKGGMLTAGAEYLVTDNFLAGVRLSIDYTEASFDSAANSDISGYGWLAGPYISAEIVKNVFLDGFVGYGTSWNNYDGSYEGLALSGDFETQRIAGYVNVSGNYRNGAVELTPLLGIAYGREWSGAFDVHNAVVGDTGIDSQEAELGRLTARVEAGYLVTDEPGDKLELFLAPKVTYDLVRDGGDYVDALMGDSAWRGGLEGGFRLARNRVGASLLLGYDGIGLSDWGAYQGQMQFSYSW